MLNLDGLDDFVEARKPSGLDQLYYFFIDRGVTPSQLDELPIPFIMSMLGVHSFVMKEQEKASKRKR